SNERMTLEGLMQTPDHLDRLSTWVTRIPVIGRPNDTPRPRHLGGTASGSTSDRWRRTAPLLLLAAMAVTACDREEGQITSPIDRPGAVASIVGATTTIDFEGLASTNVCGSVALTDQVNGVH